MEGNYVEKSRYEGRVGGMAYVASVINQLRSEKFDKTLLVDAGDTWHGSGMSVFDKGVSMVKAMNAIGMTRWFRATGNFSIQKTIC